MAGIELLKKFWYLILLIAIPIVYELFKPKIKGFTGETTVAHILSTLDKSKYKVINNLMLKVGDRTSQIDHVVVSSYGVFVIETKNYKGWITGNEYDDYWKQTIYKRKEKLRNPIKQNYGHIQALEQVLGEHSELKFIPIIVFTTNADLKVNTITEVTYTASLLKTIGKYSEKTISDEVIEKVYTRLVFQNVDSKENRKEHVQAIHSNINEKNNKIKNNICPRCGGSLVIRNGKYGKFRGCNNFPKCRFVVN